jgi:hypothetical protein
MKLKFNVLSAFPVLLLVVSCQVSSSIKTREIKKNIVYFKDERTNLCFAGINSTNINSLSETTSISCVPCDSLKNVNIE